MTDRELDQRLRAWYAAQVGETETAPEDLRESVVAIPSTAPAPLRLLRRRGNYSLLAVAAVLLVGGALAAGSGMVRFSVVPPAPSEALLTTPGPSTSEAPTDTPVPTANLRAGGLIAFTKKEGSQYNPEWAWIVGADGGGAHPLLADTELNYVLQGWSPDGAYVMYTSVPYGGGRSQLYLTDPSGGQPQLVDTGCIAQTTDPAACEESQLAVSADGQSIAFIRRAIIVEDGIDGSAVVTMDLASGRTSVLKATAPQASRPRWSPDGRQIVYTTEGDGFKDLHGQFVPHTSVVWVIDSDGQNPRQVSPAGFKAHDAAWSPDGARIVFESIDAETRELYTVKPDGTDVRRLTTDGASMGPSWTPDGRILFTRRPTAEGDEAAGWWIMDADGSDAALFMTPAAIGMAPEDIAYTRPIWQPLGGPAVAPPPWTPQEVSVVGPPPPTPLPPPPTLPPELSAGFSWTGQPSVSKDGGIGETATRLADGRVLVAGGCSTDAQVYDPATNSFSPTGSLSRPRRGTTATLLRDGRVLFAGGSACVDGDAPGASAELYDPTTGTFSPTGSMVQPRSQHTATLLADGRVLIAGGMPESSASVGAIRLASYRTVDTDHFLATAELYDPSSGTFRKTDSMSSPHRGHTATLLKDGRVLVVGNGGESSPAGTIADLYDPATGKFTRTGSMNHGRWLHTATLLADGRVLVVGGRTKVDSVRASAEFFDPASNKFSSAEALVEGRQAHTATLLPDGRVLIAGGSWSDGQTSRGLSSVEMYDPATGRFNPIGSMGARRDGHSAILLGDGRVLIVGGEDIGPEGGFGVPSAVLYQP